MRRLIFTGMFVLAAMPGFAQDGTTQELAAQYTALPGVQRMMDKMFSPEAATAQMRSALPPNMEISPEKMVQIGTIMSDLLVKTRPDLEIAMTQGAAEHFSATELRALIAFYQSPEGESVMQKMQPYFQDVMAKIMPMMQKSQMKMGREIMKVLQSDD